jgi:hypothetical protein
MEELILEPLSLPETPINEQKFRVTKPVEYVEMCVLDSDTEITEKDSQIAELQLQKESFLRAIGRLQSQIEKKEQLISDLENSKSEKIALRTIILKKAEEVHITPIPVQDPIDENPIVEEEPIIYEEPII